MKLVKRFSEKYDLILFSTLVATLCFCFQVIFINFTVTASGECFHRLYQPELTLLESPFWNWTLVIFSLLAWLIVLLTSRVLAKEFILVELVFFIVALIVLGYWLLAMNGLWDTMQFEYGYITPEQYYSSDSEFAIFDNMLSAYQHIQGKSPFVCN